MTRLIVFSFLIMPCCILYSQDIYFNLRERESPDSSGIGASNFSFHYRGYLDLALSHTTAQLGLTILRKDIKLERNPIIDIEYFSRNALYDYSKFTDITSRLLDFYELEKISNSTEFNTAIYILSVSQPSPDLKNGGTSFKNNGDIELVNSSLADICGWFKYYGILVKVESQMLLERKVSVLVPYSFINSPEGKEKEIQMLLQKNGIQCEIVEEAAIQIVPKNL